MLKKQVCIIVMVIMSIWMFSFDANAQETSEVASGECGENIVWSLDSNGLLTISGSGKMYDCYAAHWWDGKKVKSVSINGDIDYIGSYVFLECYNLTSINIPDSVTSIGFGAFIDCSSLTSVTIPENVTGIGDYAFYGCDSLMSVIIPEGVTSIGREAFGGTEWLENKRTENPLVVVNGILIDAQTSNGDVTIPDSVTSIGKSAFYLCSGLTSINIPDSVTSIGEDAFYFCSSLTSVNIPSSVTSIGNGAFGYCSSLTSVNIPSSMTSIENMTFANCDSLTSVRFPDSMVRIGEAAFVGCINLKFVFYRGTSAQWNSIDIETNNFNLILLAIHYSAADHIWNSDYTVDVESTYTVAGSKSIHCSVCDVIKEDSSVSIPVKERIEATGKFALLKSYLLEKGQTDDDGNKYFQSSTMVSDKIGAIATITYIEDEARFQFYHEEINNSRIVSTIVMFIEENGSQTVAVDYSHDVFSINASATFDVDHYVSGGKEYFEKTSTNILDNSEIQDLCNAALKSAFLGWDAIFLKNLGFDVNMADMGFTSYEEVGKHTGDGVVTKKPTCNEKGIMTYTCIICGTTETEEIPKLNSHTWDSGIITKEATTTSEGEKTFTCTVCKTTRKEAIPKKTGNSSVNNNSTKKIQTIKVTTSKKISVKKVKKKVQSFKLSAQSTSGNKVKYILAKKNKNIKFSASSGKVTVKKGTKKGTYKIKVAMFVLGNEKYHEYSTIKTITIKVK